MLLLLLLTPAADTYRDVPRVDRISHDDALWETLPLQCAMLIAAFALCSDGKLLEVAIIRHVDQLHCVAFVTLVIMLALDRHESGLVCVVVDQTDHSHRPLMGALGVVFFVFPELSAQRQAIR